MALVLRSLGTHSSQSSRDGGPLHWLELRHLIIVDLGAGLPDIYSHPSSSAAKVTKNGRPAEMARPSAGGHSAALQVNTHAISDRRTRDTGWPCSRGRPRRGPLGDSKYLNPSTADMQPCGTVSGTPGCDILHASRTCHSKL